MSAIICRWFPDGEKMKFRSKKSNTKSCRTSWNMRVQVRREKSIYNTRFVRGLVRNWHRGWIWHETTSRQGLNLLRNEEGSECKQRSRSFDKEGNCLSNRICIAEFYYYDIMRELKLAITQTVNSFNEFFSEGFPRTNINAEFLSIKYSNEFQFNIHVTNIRIWYWGNDSRLEEFK